MSARFTDSRSFQQRSVLTMTDMARALNLSRSRFYALVESGVFPMPLYLVKSKRPFYDARLRDECLEIRRTGLGANGEPVFFYPKRVGVPVWRSSSSARKKEAAKQIVNPIVERLIDLLRGLGIDNPTPKAVSDALRDCYPDGISGRGEGELVAEVFRHMRAVE